ncbi:hypothetical protein HGP14_14725 [Rhizobium sp. P32RR-XVIII]|uniref:hypothetical protein n=1 Tax=Rhizobium sp. P32RR-XVIII TaxID=2726738 RepID=UPI001457704C|nr:hypothetical protein [Rhizobium sp. P32RR-XVIII]NLS04610.1 hypothetical protein [Rhizobium sp. P32RR-XVIII]
MSYEPQKYMFRGRLRTVNEIAELTGRHPQAIYDRRQGSYIPDNAEVEKRVRERLKNAHGRAHYVTFEGKRLSLKDWAREFGMPYTTAQLWRRKGMSIEEIATKARATYLQPSAADRRQP